MSLPLSDDNETTTRHQHKSSIQRPLDSSPISGYRQPSHVPELTAPSGFHRLVHTAQSVMAISTSPLVEPTHPEARLDNPHHP
ncbi:hypothetical protein PGTUg99_007573 [Puccinia graminis f. sp. tritici]|uniref:Uncharacterized protein n=1 Tax=Puccinia graminis f. sp. tritici TaxID=56615 RepID=A0A5B0QYY8_PUCGR|nr:hypothetical protein PGTUg99_007573 [Puccinia graminis f. sp. tritici]